ncbi:MAG TPA: DUF3658 domain-containing protein [Stellaceae bacterium]|nr:DUF3658 domain-containing protein [Stellaceae bacterium]
MPASTVHILVGESAGSSLRQALRSMKRDDCIVAMDDDLSIGPIDPAEPKARIAWMAEELGYDVDEALVGRVERFWVDALAPADRRIVWTSRRSARDYAGFLEWLWRLGDQGCEIVGLTDARFPDRCAEGPAGYLSLVISPGILSPDQIVAMGLLDRAEPLAPAVRAGYRDLWRRLRTENAPLRVVSETGLSSAPITVYDDELMSYAVPQWRKVARIVGEALTNQHEYFQCADLLLAARVRALAKAGRLEARGNPLEMRFSEVRLPAG